MPELVIGPLGAFVVPPLGTLRIAGGDLKMANARLLLHRTAMFTDNADGLDDAPILAAAVASRLGQDAELVEAVAARRAVAMGKLGNVATLRLEIQGAIVSGTATGGIRDVGIELHGTYGWPILLGSSLKGVAREFARQVGTPHLEIFGSAPEDESQTPGSVTFFDALPSAAGVGVAAHVLTPHTRGYRSAADGERGPVAPAEHVSPFPIPFLAVNRGIFVAHLAGPVKDVEIAATLLRDAVDDLGVGARTAAGYGYLRVES